MTKIKNNPDQPYDWKPKINQPRYIQKTDEPRYISSPIRMHNMEESYEESCKFDKICWWLLIFSFMINIIWLIL